MSTDDSRAKCFTKRQFLQMNPELAYLFPVSFGLDDPIMHLGGQKERTQPDACDIEAVSKKYSRYLKGKKNTRRRRQFLFSLDAIVVNGDIAKCMMDARFAAMVRDAFLVLDGAQPEELSIYLHIISAVDLAIKSAQGFEAISIETFMRRSVVEEAKVNSNAAFEEDFSADLLLSLVRTGIFPAYLDLWLHGGDIIGPTVQKIDIHAKEITVSLDRNKRTKNRIQEASPMIRGLVHSFLKEYAAGGHGRMMLNLKDKEQPKISPHTEGFLNACLCCEKRESKKHQFKKCAACKCAVYCSKKCQKKHWKTHKLDCKRMIP